MLGLLETDRAVSVVTYSLSSLAIYWGCKRSVADDSRTASSRADSIRHDHKQDSGATPTPWRGRLISGAGVIVAVCLMGVLSHLIVYLLSRKLQNRLFAIAAIAQATFGMYRLLGETISANSHRISTSSLLSKLRAATIPLAFGLAVALVSGVYNGHRWIQGVLVAIIVFSAVCIREPEKSIRSQIRWICTIPIGGLLFAGLLFILNDFTVERTPTQNTSPQDNGYVSPEGELIFALTLATMSLTKPGLLLATTLQYEHFKAEEREEKLEIIPWRIQVDTALYSAASRIFYLEMFLLSTAEILAPPFALKVIRGMTVVCATSVPVVIRLMVLARRGGVYEEYMSYPCTGSSVEFVDSSNDVEAITQ